MVQWWCIFYFSIVIFHKYRAWFSHWTTSIYLTLELEWTDLKISVLFLWYFFYFLANISVLYTVGCNAGSLIYKMVEEFLLFNFCLPLENDTGLHSTNIDSSPSRMTFAKDKRCWSCYIRKTGFTNPNWMNNHYFAIISCSKKKWTKFLFPQNFLFCLI